MMPPPLLHRPPRIGSPRTATSPSIGGAPSAVPSAAATSAAAAQAGAPAAPAWRRSGWTLPELAYVLLATIAVSIIEGVLLKSQAVHGLPMDEQLLVRGVVVIVYYVILLSFVWWLAARRERPFAAAVGLRGFQWGPALLAIVGYLIAVRGLSVLYAIVLRVANVRVPGSDIDITSFFGLSTVGILVTVLIAGVFGPFVEEVVFRGVVFGGLADIMPAWAAIVASALLFAVLHFNAYLTVPAFLVGVALALIYRRQGSLWPAVMLHAAYNITSIVSAYALQHYLMK